MGDEAARMLVPGHRYQVKFYDADGNFGGWFEATFVRLTTFTVPNGDELVGTAVFDTAEIGGIDACTITEVST